MKQQIDIHIDELLLDGFTAAEGDNIKTAVEAELSRLFTERGIPRTVNRSAKYDRINGGSFSMANGSKANTVGTDIAGAVYSSIMRPGRQS